MRRTSQSGKFVTSSPVVPRITNEAPMAAKKNPIGKRMTVQKSKTPERRQRTPMLMVFADHALTPFFLLVSIACNLVILMVISLQLTFQSKSIRLSNK